MEVITPATDIVLPQQVIVTAFQQRIMELLANGYAQKQVAVKLNSTTYTINSQVKHMLSYNRCKNVVQLVYMASKQGVI